MEPLTTDGSRARRVLVIDDSELARECMTRLLERAGFTVFQLGSGIGATRCILANQVNAVVVDVSMPGLSGDKLVEVLRGNPRLSGLVIVVVSARNREELQRMSFAVRADAILSKDQLDTRLVAVLERHLEMQGAAPARPARQRA